MPDNPVSKRLDLPSIVSLLVIVVAVFGALCILAAVGVLDSDDAAAWMAAVFTGGLLIVAGAALWPAARQVKLAAQASTESHRPYVSLGTRLSVKGILYFDLVNHGDRAALGVTARFSESPLHGPISGPSAEQPFGQVSYLAPGERRSIFYATSQDSERLPKSLDIEIAYTGEDGEPHGATITHDLDALTGLLTNPDDIRTPQALIQEGLDGLKRIVDEVFGQVTKGTTAGTRPPSKGCLRRLKALLRRARARGRS